MGDRVVEPIGVIEGQVSFLDRDDVDTDQIIPKQFLKRIERTGFGEFLFHDWKKEEGWELHPHPILVAGRNFGCGSSREHAPWALQDYGFSAIIAPSFADIFFANSTKVGLLPVVLSADECKAIAAAGSARIDLDGQQVAWGDDQSADFEIDAEIKRRLLDGLDDIALTIFQAEMIDAYESTMERHGPVTTAL